jgi:dipeptidyl aminopeptidase/acylaminoacyl peptidase
VPKRIVAVAWLCLCAGWPVLEASAFDAAAAFGARPSVSDLTLSPDGMRVAWIAPAAGQGAVVYTMSLAKDAKAQGAFTANGNGERVSSCRWVSNERLVCTVALMRKDPTLGVVPISRVIAVNIDGTNQQMLSTRENSYSHGWQLGGGEVIDWLPDAESSVLMVRVYLADDRTGSRIGSADAGLGVDQLDTRNLQSHRIEPPRREAMDYISDGRGHVRIVGLRSHDSSGNDTGTVEFLYHPADSQELQPLASYHSADRSGFLPVAVDPDLNVAYGFKKLEGRSAVYSIALDGSRHEQLIYANPEVDVAGLIRIGRRNRVVGATYITEYRHAVFFAPEIKALTEALAKALPQHPRLRIVDASVDESRLLVLASSDTDPGVYYIFDRKSHELQTFLVVRSQLEGVKLAAVKPVTYAAADGTSIPAYLTLPAGMESAKGLPALVLPHGGPGARDEWGFDWLAQFFAARGYAVLQPNFRGSAGYGDAWFVQNGFRSWNVAVGDVIDGGRWLVNEGIADPGKLAILGWSYGGYAALQSAVVEPTLFKAVVAIAPVTDLNELKEEHRHWSDFELVSHYVGDGPHTREGSPAQHADRFRVPVLLFHGGLDRNVGIQQSRLMEERLKAAGAKCTLVTWDDLDHYLENSSARAQLLSQSDAFLRASFGMSTP